MNWRNADSYVTNSPLRAGIGPRTTVVYNMNVPAAVSTWDILAHPGIHVPNYTLPERLLDGNNILSQTKNVHNFTENL